MNAAAMKVPGSPSASGLGMQRLEPDGGLRGVAICIYGWVVGGQCQSRDSEFTRNL